MQWQNPDKTWIVRIRKNKMMHDIFGIQDTLQVYYRSILTDFKINPIQWIHVSLNQLAGHRVWYSYVWHYNVDQVGVVNKWNLWSISATSWCLFCSTQLKALSVSAFGRTPYVLFLLICAFSSCSLLLDLSVLILTLSATSTYVTIL